MLNHKFFHILYFNQAFVTLLNLSNERSLGQDAFVGDNVD